MTKRIWLAGRGEFSGERDTVILSLEGWDNVVTLYEEPTEEQMLELSNDDPYFDGKTDYEFCEYGHKSYLYFEDIESYFVAVEIEIEDEESNMTILVEPDEEDDIEYDMSATHTKVTNNSEACKRASARRKKRGK